MAQRLEIIISAKDETKKVFGGVTKNLQRVGKIALGVAAGGIAALGAGMAAFGTKAVMAAADAEEMMSKFGFTFGETAERLESSLSSFADATGRSRFELMTMAADMGAVAKGMGFNEEAAAKLSDQMTQLAVDVGSFNNLPSADVAQRFTAALTGEFESLKRLGIVINQNRIDQELMNRGIRESWQELDQMTKSSIIAEMIMESASDAQGDAARTADSFTNQMVALRAKMSDVTTEIGLKLLPVITPLLTTLGDLAATWLPRVVDAISPFLDRLGTVITLFTEFGIKANTIRVAIEHLFGEEIADRIFNIVDAIMNFKDTATEMLEPILNWVEDNVELKDVLIALGIAIGIVVIPALLGFLGTVLAIAAPILALVAVVAIVRKAWETDWNGMRTTLTAFWENSAKPAFEQVRQWLQVNIPKAIETAKQFWENTLLPAIQNVGGWITDTLIPTLSDVWDWLQTNIPEAIQTLSDFWENTLKPVIQKSMENIETYVIPLWKDIAELLEVTVLLAAEALAVLWETVLLPALTAVWEFIDDKVIPIFEDVAEWLGEKLGLSTDEAGEKIGLLQEAFVGIRGAIEDVVDWIKSAIEWLRKLRDTDAGPYMGESPSPFEVALRGIADAFRDAKDAAEQTIRAFFDLGSSFIRFGGSAGTMFEEDTIAPLRERLEIINEQIAALGTEADGTRILIGLEEQRKDIVRSIAQEEAKAARLRETEQRLSFLQDQADLLNTIKEHGLNAKTILGNIKLGVDADPGSILEAMTRATEAIINQTQLRLFDQFPGLFQLSQPGDFFGGPATIQGGGVQQQNLNYLFINNNPNTALLEWQRRQRLQQLGRDL